MPGRELIGLQERLYIQQPLRKTLNLPPRYFRDRFEEELCKYLGCKYALVVSSGTAAVHLALESLELGVEGHCIMPTHTFVATAEAARMARMRPILLDIDESLNMDMRSEFLHSKYVDSNPIPLILVHMLGQPCDMEQLDFANYTVEDACQAFGAEYKGKKVGTLGNIGCFSFDIGKTITTGEGGAIVTNDKDLCERCKALHDHGHLDKITPRGMDDGYRWGYNYRMTEMQAAMGMAQLQKIDQILEGQRTNHYNLLEATMDLWQEGHLYPRDMTRDMDNTCDSFVFLCKKPKLAQKIAKGLQLAGIGTKNLPDATRWHYLPHADWMKDEMDLSHVRDSWDILSRAVAIPISCLPMEIEKIVKVIEHELEGN